MEKTIIMYGTTWCPDCVRAKKVLKKNKIEFQWIDIGQDTEARAFVEKSDNGMRIVPTILFPDGETLAEPSNTELSRKLSELGLIEN